MKQAFCLRTPCVVVPALAVLTALLSGFPRSALAQGRVVEWSVPGAGENASLYPCDAGVLHLRPTTPCRFRETSLSCQRDEAGLTLEETGRLPGSARTFVGSTVTIDTQDTHRCACMSEDANLGDRLRWEAALPAGSPSGAQAEVGLLTGSAKGASVARVRLAKDPKPLSPLQASFAQPLGKVTFELGSEAFGTQSYVDLCYLGTSPSKIDSPARPGQASPPPKYDIPDFATSAWLMAALPTGFTPAGTPSPAAYDKLARLVGNWDLACTFFDLGTPSSLSTAPASIDIVEQGTRPLPASVSTRAEFYDAAPPSTEGWVGRLQGPFTRRGDLATIGTDIRYLFGSATTPLALTRGSDGAAPRACRMRLYFWEASTGRARDWSREGTRFTVKWNVTGTTK